MIHLICIDVDGTLVGSSGVVDPAVWDAASRARDRGVRLALCSGRPAFGLARTYAARLFPDGWHIFQNGASIVRLPDGQSMSSPLPGDIVERLVRRARGTGRILELYTDTAYATESHADRARQHAGLLGVPFTPRPFESLRGSIVRAQWLVSQADEAAVLGESHPGLEQSASTSPVMPETVFVNLTLAGVDKGSAVCAVARGYGIALAEVMVVGDGQNDMRAMQRVGLAVAMGNAEPAVKKVARHTVGPVDHGGLVEALELALASGR